MSKLIWDQIGERTYETGVDHAVLFPSVNGTYPKGVAWSGITNITESPSGAEPNPFYADNIKYLNLMSAEDFSASIGAYTYPTEFEECDGSAEVAPGVLIGQQTRKVFGLSYRSKIGNDTDGQDHGYKLHLVYNALAAPSERSHQTVNESPEPTELSWEVSTTPVEVPGYKPTAHFTIDSTRTDARKLKMLEDIIYGTEKTEPRMPMPAEIIELMTAPLPTEVTVTATDGKTKRYEKSVSDLQESIVIDNVKKTITGTLKWVTGYNLSAEIPKDGNFIALDMNASNGGKITTELTNRAAGTKVIAVDDGFCVYHVENNKQKLRVTVSKDTYTDTVEYDLSGLTLKTAAN